MRIKYKALLDQYENQEKGRGNEPQTLQR